MTADGSTELGELFMPIRSLSPCNKIVVVCPKERERTKGWPVASEAGSYRAACSFLLSGKKRQSQWRLLSLFLSHAIDGVNAFASYI
jgi:hypothetical protein